jgi:hypothetical protein
MATSEVIKFASAFAQEVASGNSGKAHEMLSDELGQAVTEAELSSQFETLADDMGGVTGVGEPMVILEQWPDMSEHDRAMVYVPLEGDCFSEAITVTVAEIDGAFRVSAIEWGRP